MGLICFLLTILVIGIIVFLFTVNHYRHIEAQQ